MALDCSCCRQTLMLSGKCSSCCTGISVTWAELQSTDLGLQRGDSVLLGPGLFSGSLKLHLQLLGLRLATVCCGFSCLQAMLKLCLCLQDHAHHLAQQMLILGLVLPNKKQTVAVLHVPQALLMAGIRGMLCNGRNFILAQLRTLHPESRQ